MNNETKMDHCIDETFLIVKNLLQKQFSVVPLHGVIGVKIIIRDGKPVRIVSKNQTSTLISYLGEKTDNKSIPDIADTFEPEGLLLNYEKLKEPDRKKKSIKLDSDKAKEKNNKGGINTIKF